MSFIIAAVAFIIAAIIITYMIYLVWLGIAGIIDIWRGKEKGGYSNCSGILDNYRKRNNI